MDSVKSFPGYPEFLHAAALELGCPEAEVPARRIQTLSAVSNLCAQASLADPAHVASILDKAVEFRDQLHAAYRAADLMIDAVRPPSPAAAPAAPPPPSPRNPKARRSE